MRRSTPRGEMYKLIATLLIAGLAGVPTYLLVFGGRFEVSGRAPVGMLEPMEAWLVGHGFAKAPLSPTEAGNHELEGQAFVGFTETGSSMKGSGKYLVAIGVLDNGSVQTVRMSFYSGKAGLGIPSSKTEEFAELLWREVAGGNPGFEERHRGQGIRFTEGLGATFSSRFVSGDWYKQYQETGKPGSIVDYVAFTTR